jgi:hypothetical protein
VRGAIARAKARGELPARPYAVHALLSGHRVLHITPAGALTGGGVSEAEVQVLTMLAARYATPDYPFGLLIEGAPEPQQRSLEATNAPKPE